MDVARGARCSTGSRRTPSGSSAGSSTSSVNCLDRHLRGPRRNKAAIIWEGEPGDRRVLTYWDLAREVGRCANALKRLGVQQGDRVAIYLPMVPEAAIAMLACARIGAVHSVVFGGFSAEALRDRINDAGAVALITADGGYRRGQIVPLKRMADGRWPRRPRSSTASWCAAGRRRGRRGVRRDDRGPGPLVAPAAGARVGRLPGGGDGRGGPALHPLHLRHHREAQGHRPHHRRLPHPVASTTRHVFDLSDEDVFWCTADVGWVTGHSYVVYGPLANGATVLMYEGAPDWPERDRFWRAHRDATASPSSTPRPPPSAPS